MNHQPDWVKWGILVTYSYYDPYKKTRGIRTEEEATVSLPCGRSFCIKCKSECGDGL